MRLLGYVWVGLHCFTVFEQENPKVDDDECDGYFDNQSHMIVIKAGMPVSRQREVLMHELMHGAWWVSQLAVDPRKRQDEETVCTRLAPIMAEIINKNAWISAFIEDRVK